ncbi:MAG: hypothetical protein LBE34_14645 [Flavobacteriaceae bacterium]|jgi:hypothetical protein|nr:hypothetical protein [Flavobacteriaceae bacterium]
MRKKILLIITPLLLCAWGHNTFATNSSPKKKQLVLDKVAVNYFDYRDEELEDNEEYKLLIANDSLILVGAYELTFLYNDSGDLHGINTVSKAPPIYTELTLNQQKQLERIKIIEGNTTIAKTAITYSDNLLQQIQAKELNTNTELLLHYKYNKELLPSVVKGEKNNNGQSSDSLQISFKYNKEKQLVAVAGKDRKFKLSYDKANNPYTYLPYFYTHESQPILDMLFYTNYRQKHNITRIEDTEELTTITYTYNQNNLPITAIVKNILKQYPTYPRSFTQYKYSYKEIEIIE